MCVTDCLDEVGHAGGFEGLDDGVAAEGADGGDLGFGADEGVHGVVFFGGEDARDVAGDLWGEEGGC